MRKAEAEQGIRQLCYKWGQENGVTLSAESDPSFSDFCSWLSAKGYSNYLDFRSTMGPREDAERWFNDVFKQNWRY
jgi:hypothetical protein